MEHDVIVIGASAGGIDPFLKIIKELPKDLDAAVFFVVHRPPGPAVLPAIFNQRGGLAAVQPRDGELIQRGHLYVAPPDFHMLIDEERIQLWRGPKENYNRPSINALFRSAAAAYKQRVVGIVLSGMLDDGTAGLWWVKRHGGITIVQDPETAAFPEMPRSALKYVEPDHILSPFQIGKQITLLTGATLGERR